MIGEIFTEDLGFQLNLDRWVEFHVGLKYSRQKREQQEQEIEVRKYEDNLAVVHGLTGSEDCVRQEQGTSLGRWAVTVPVRLLILDSYVCSVGPPKISELA